MRFQKSFQKEIHLFLLDKKNKPTELFLNYQLSIVNCQLNHQSFVTSHIKDGVVAKNKVLSFDAH